ncbi:MAG: response regulator [Planctomycetes bacterium]|nr:response regulator [Planctomycetota bacterium]
MKIIVVDDDRLNCLTMVQLLKDAGHEVCSFEAADEALKLIEADHVQAAIVDFRMPRMDGFTFLTKVRAKKPGIPVIMMSAHWTPKSLEDARKLGVTAHLTKPFDMDDLLAILAKLP